MSDERCERAVGHPGTCAVRCHKTQDCTEPSGHRRHCTAGTFNCIAWAADGDRCTFAAGTVERWVAEVTQP